MFRIRKRFSFEGAHQLAPGMCETQACSDTIHGHSYKVDVFLTSPRLNVAGMVLDFSCLSFIKDIVEEWDHALILSPYVNEPYLGALMEWNLKLKVMDFNPTAENIAMELFDRIKRRLQEDFPANAGSVVLEKVRVWETEKAWAEYSESAEDIANDNEGVD